MLSRQPHGGPCDRKLLALVLLVASILLLGEFLSLHRDGRVESACDPSVLFVSPFYFPAPVQRVRCVRHVGAVHYQNMHRPGPYAFPNAVKLEELERNSIIGFLEKPKDHLVEAAAKMGSENVEERREGVAVFWKEVPKVHETYMEALLKGLFDDDMQVRYDSALAMKLMSSCQEMEADPYIARIAHMLDKNTTSVERKVMCAEALGRIYVSAWPYVKSIARNVNHTDWRVRLACVNAFSRMEEAALKYTELVIPLQRDEVEEVRVAARKRLAMNPKKDPPHKACLPKWMWRKRRRLLKRKPFKVKNR